MVNRTKPNREVTLEGGARVDVLHGAAPFGDIQLRLVGSPDPIPLRAVIFDHHASRSMIRAMLVKHSDAEVVILPSIERDLAKYLQLIGLSVLDYDGNGRIEIPGFTYVVFRDQRVKQPSYVTQAERIDRQSARSASFAPRAADVTRLMLIEQDNHWTTQALARRLHMSSGYLHSVLIGLNREQFIERLEDGWRVTNRTALLDAWAMRGKPEKSKRDMRLRIDESVQATLRLLNAAIHTSSSVAVSGQAAAEQLAPYRPSTGVRLLTSDPGTYDMLKIAARSLRPVKSLSPELGTRLELWEVRPSVLEGKQHVKNLVFAVVHPIQVYIDLMQSASARDHDAAAHLRKVAIGW